MKRCVAFSWCDREEAKSNTSMHVIFRMMYWFFYGGSWFMMYEKEV
jgi:hypothetical protein